MHCLNANGFSASILSQAAAPSSRYRHRFGEPGGVSALVLTHRAGDAGARSIELERLLRTAAAEVVGEPKNDGSAFIAFSPTRRVSKLSGDRGNAPLTMREMKFQGDGSCSRGCRPPPTSAGGEAESVRLKDVFLLMPKDSCVEWQGDARY